MVSQETMTEADYANTPAQTESQLHSQEQFSGRYWSLRECK